MTFDVGPFLETVAPLSVLMATAFGIARVIYKQEEHGKRQEEQDKKIDRVLAELANQKQQHQSLERRVLDNEMYERGQEDALARRRVTSGRSRRPRSTR